MGVTLRPPAHCSSPEIAFAERCNEVNLQRQNSGDSLPESNNPFLAMSSADLKGMEDEVDASSDSTSSSADSDGRNRTCRRVWGHQKESENWRKRVHRPRRALMLRRRKDGQQRRGSGQKPRTQETRLMAQTRMMK